MKKINNSSHAIETSKNEGIKMKFFIFCTLFCLSFASQAEMFKCVGQNGKTTYQATKCPATAKVSTVKKADKVNDADRKASQIRAKTASSQIRSENAAYESAQSTVNTSTSAQGNSSVSNADLLQGLDMTNGADRAKAKLLTGGQSSSAASVPAPPVPSTIHCHSVGFGRSVCN